MLRWEDVQDDPEPDLKRLLMQKKKRKEVPALESDDPPQCVRVRTTDCSIKVWCAAWFKNVWKKKAIQRKRRELQQKRIHR